MQVFPEVKQVLAEFKSKYNLSELGAQGFCWGGKYTVLLLGMAQSCHYGPAGTSQHCIFDPLRPPKGSPIHPSNISWGFVSIWGLDPSVLTTTLSGLAGSPFGRNACLPACPSAADANVGSWRPSRAACEELLRSKVAAQGLATSMQAWCATARC